MNQADATKKERRERIATAVLSALATNPHGTMERNIALAITAADALIAELDKDQPHEP